MPGPRRRHVVAAPPDSLCTRPAGNEPAFDSAAAWTDDWWAIAGTCPVLSWASGFVVTVRGRQLVDAFIDEFYTELADLAEPD